MTKKPHLRLVTPDFKGSAEEGVPYVRIEEKNKNVTEISKKAIGAFLPRFMTASNDARIDFYLYLTFGDPLLTDEGAKLIAKTEYGQRGAAWDKAINYILDLTFRMESGGTFDFSPSVLIDKLTPEEWARMRDEVAAADAQPAQNTPKPQEP